MKVTIKNIMKALPRFDMIRMEYMFPGETGTAHGRGYLAAAYADVHDDGSVTVTIYSVGDAMKRQHYYNEPGSYDIYAEIEDVLLWSPYDSLKSSSEFRREIAHRIQEVIG